MKKLLLYLIGTFVLVSSYDSVHANEINTNDENSVEMSLSTEIESANFQGRIIISGRVKLLHKEPNLYIFECIGTGTCIDIDFDQRIIRVPDLNLEVPFSSSVLVNGTDYNGLYQTLPNGQYEIEID